MHSPVHIGLLGRVELCPFLPLAKLSGPGTVRVVGGGFGGNSLSGQNIAIDM